jgi:carbonic anhydrase/acetyltransferase-like protein (isoleucine patch superfamily)
MKTPPARGPAAGWSKNWSRSMESLARALTASVRRGLGARDARGDPTSGLHSGVRLKANPRDHKTVKGINGALRGREDFANAKGRRMPVYRLADADLEVEEEGAWWIAPTAVVIGRVILKRNASVWFGAVLRGDNEPIVIGENSNIQDGSVLHTDMGAPLMIGRDVTVGHQAMLHGCTIGDNSLVGIKATVLNHAVIGDDSLVGAHALVTERKTFEPGQLITGAPARVARAMSPEQIRMNTFSAQHYVDNWKRYARDLQEH